ncbi:MAG: hypothetical protein HWE13_01945 [Gammaproteobacteria bacterium]|nr:hypothetical protein [Gammaproteobacteria bacterium]NVK86854.1 hypothetical protein [Gammaproteobacteria bacterium]
MLQKQLVIGLFIACLLGCQSALPPGTDSTLTTEQRDDYVTKMCQEHDCQYNVRVVLKTAQDELYDQTFSAMAVVQDNGAMVVAGQTLYFEADVDGDRLTNFKRVESVTAPEKTIIAKLRQMKDGAMMLTLTNPFGRALRINMGIMPLNKETLYATSSCPVIAGGRSFELWPYPIFQVWLGDMTLLNNDADMSCR